MARKAPSLGPISRSGVALHYLNRGIRMTICDPDSVGRVVDVLQRLPGYRPPPDEIVASLVVTMLKPFTPGSDHAIEWVAAELTRSIQAGIFMEQVPEFDRMTDKQKLAQLDALDAAMVQLDETFGQLRRETWAEVLSVNPDLPPMPDIVRGGIYHLWPGLHEAVRESRRRLQHSAPKRGSRPTGPAARAAAEFTKIYRWLTGEDATVYWDAAAGKYKGKCLTFLTEVFEIFGIDGDPAQYLRQ